MPLELHPMTPSDSLSWTRIRALAYYGPTHDILHDGPVSELSICGVAQDRRNEIGRPNTWHWKVVDTDLEPGEDDPENNGGRTIAVAIWSALNNHGKGSIGGQKAEEQEKVPFLPPELRLDALGALLGPLNQAQKEIMGNEKPYLMLNTLATHPQHQHRGAGKMLLGWGVRKADEEGLTCYLDTSQVARKMYEARGFKLIREVRFDRTDWGGEGVDWYGCMVREPHPK